MNTAPEQHRQTSSARDVASPAKRPPLNGEHDYQLEVIVNALEHEVELLDIRLDHIDATLDLLLKHLGVPTQSYVIREERDEDSESLIPSNP